MRDASEPRLGRLRPIQWRIRGKNRLPAYCVDKAFLRAKSHPLSLRREQAAYSVFPLMSSSLNSSKHPLENLGGTGTSSSFQESMMPKLAPPPAPDSPEEIPPHGFPVQDSPVNIHDSGRQSRGPPPTHIFATKHPPPYPPPLMWPPVPTVGTNTAGKAKVFALISNVQNGKGEGGNKGNALVIVATASGPELDVILSGANECSSDVGFP
nr:hypothetical protein Iba_chr04eCG9330 [Ipomoea batatas]